MRKICLVTLLVLATSLLSFGVVLAQTPVPETATTSAVIPATGQPPVVNAMWMLPDMQAGVAGVQYGTAANAHQHDDDMTQTGIQVMPNLGDLPGQRALQYWVMVEDPNGLGDIQDVFIKVYHPDGSFKYQLHLVKQECAVLGSATAAGTPLEAAVHTGQITSAAAGEIVTLCNKNMKAPYMVVGPISKDQPFGTYTWTATGVDLAGGTTPSSATFDVLQRAGFEIDFSTVNFGDIVPGAVKWVNGDEVFGTAAYPTVQSIGNVWLNLNIHFTAMTGANYQKLISLFDAKVGTTGGFQVPFTLDPIAASTNYPFDNYLLLPNVPTQLDLSIHPPYGTPGDAYTGRVDLWGTSAPPASQWVPPFWPTNVPNPSAPIDI